MAFIALTRILKTGAPELSFQKMGVPPYKRIEPPSKIGVPDKIWEFKTANQQLVRTPL